MKREHRQESQRWFAQARRDLDDANFARDGGRYNLACIKSDGAALDKYYIPTRYPDGLPGGIPADAYQNDDANLAIEKAARIISFVEEKL